MVNDGERQVDGIQIGIKDKVGSVADVLAQLQDFVDQVTMALETFVGGEVLHLTLQVLPLPFDFFPSALDLELVAVALHHGVYGFDVLGDFRLLLRHRPFEGTVTRQVTNRCAPMLL